MAYGALFLVPKKLGSTHCHTRYFPSPPREQPSCFHHPSQTTFMNLMSGDLIPCSGESRRSHKLRIGRYAQHFVDALSMDVNPVEYLLEKYPTAGLKPEGMRAMLGRFGLSGQHHLTPICKLSGAVAHSYHIPLLCSMHAPD